MHLGGTGREGWQHLAAGQAASRGKCGKHMESALPASEPVTLSQSISHQTPNAKRQF